MEARITIIENETTSLWYYPEAGIVHHQFRQPVEGDSFRNILMGGLRLMNERGAARWLSDDRGNSILSADDGAWSQEYWLPLAVKAGWKYWAVLPPARARGQINMQRLTAFVGANTGIGIQVFSDPDEAWRWLAVQGREQV